MAAYREHISVSGLLGLGYGLAAHFVFGFTPVQGALAGVLTWVAGMLPDLDSASGKPVRELFSLIAAVVPIVLFRRLFEWGVNEEGAMLLAVLLYGGVRFGAPLVVKMFAVHRGMFHSIPALLIAAELTFLAYKSDSLQVKFLMAAGVAVGFLSHLVLDELYSVQWTGIRLRLNKAAGSALKLFGKGFVANAVAYGLLATVTYMTLVDAGLVREDEGVFESPLLGEPAEAETLLDAAAREEAVR